jgi:hypothetical protein
MVSKPEGRRSKFVGPSGVRWFRSTHAAVAVRRAREDMTEPERLVTNRLAGNASEGHPPLVPTQAIARPAQEEALPYNTWRRALASRTLR